jgi:TRAP transporter 4TM/12TM fusion protein
MTETADQDSAPARPAPARYLVNAVATLLTLIPLMWAMDVHTDLALALFDQQLLVGSFGAAVVIVYLTIDIRRQPATKIAWYDWLAAALGAGTTAWMVIDYRHFTEQVVGFGGVSAVVTGMVVVLLALEGLRRTTGPTLLCVVLAFLVYMWIADLIPGDLKGTPAALDEAFIYLGWQANSLFGTPMKISVVVVIAFVFLGKLLLKTGGGEFITDISMALMGRSRGGAAKIAVVASGLFGSISGSAVSNVASTGVITIPLMKRSGYTAVQAGAIEAVASTGGQFMPPMMGAAAFLMAEFLEVPYVEVVIAAFVPAVLYYFAVFVEVDLIAAKNNIAVADAALPKALLVLKEGWHFIIPFVVLLYALFELALEAEQAAIWSCFAIAALGVVRVYKGERLNFVRLYEAFRDTGMVMVELIMIVAAAGMVIGVINYTTIGFAITDLLARIGEGNLFLLLGIAAFASILLGMGMPTSGIYVLLAALIVPSLIESGVHQFAAHLFILYFGLMSMLTPPVALCAYTAAPIAGADPIQIGLVGMRLAWTAYVVPFLFVLSPTLLLFGEPMEIVFDVVTAFIGIYVLSVAMVGYFSRPLPVVLRLVIAAAGAASLMPSAVMPTDHLLNLAGIALGAAILGYEFLVARRLGAGAMAAE